MDKIKVVGEIGINHNGNMSIVKDMIKLAVKNGLDCVKFQKRDVEICYSKEDLDKPRESPWGTTNREQKMGLELTKENYDWIDAFCKKQNIQWTASVWDIPSVDFICQYQVPFIKVPSALITDFKLLDYIDQKGIETVMSVGMSTKEEVDDALEILGSTCTTIMHTTSSYPTPLAELNLSKIITLRNEYGEDYKIGYSNHFKSPMAIMFAGALGIDMLEYHYTLDRASYGSDQAASLESKAMEMINDWLIDLPLAMGDGEWKIQESEKAVMQKLRRYSPLV